MKSIDNFNSGIYNNIINKTKVRKNNVMILSC